MESVIIQLSNSQVLKTAPREVEWETYTPNKGSNDNDQFGHEGKQISNKFPPKD